MEPQQERATRRFANFLDVAAVLFAQIGYEATTMTAIAERWSANLRIMLHTGESEDEITVKLLAAAC